MLPQVLVDGLTRGCAAAVLGVGIALPFTVGRFFHFAHGSLCLLGVFVTVALTSAGVSSLLALGGSLAVTMVLTVLLDAAVYQPLRSKSAGAAALLIGSLGIFAVVESAIGLIWGPAERSLASGLLRRIHLGDRLGASSVQALQVVLAAAVFGAIWLVWRFSLLGLRWRACGEDPNLSLLFGINVARETRVALVVGTLSGVAATYLVALETSVYPAMGFKLLLSGVLAAVIGGLSRPVAVLWGGLLVGVLQQVVAVYVSYRWENSIVFALLLALLLLRPQGIWGERVRADPT